MVKKMPSLRARSTDIAPGRTCSAPVSSRTTDKAMNTIHTAYYRTRDGLYDYQFSFEEQSDHSWLIFILYQPSYNGRRTDNHSTHRLTRRNRYYVCWTRKLTSLAEAKQVAALWAEATQSYIHYGTRF